MTSSIARKILCAGASAVFLAGCGALDRPASGEATSPPVNIVQTADATWMEPTGEPPFVRQVGGDNLDAPSGQSRLTVLEAQVSQISAELRRLAAGQDDIRAVLTGMKPAAGLVVPPPVAAPSVLATPAASASSVAAPPAVTVPPSAAVAQVAVPPPVPLTPAPAVAQQVPSAWSPPAAAPAATAPVVPAAAGRSSSVVQALRVGEHPGRTRIVLDVSSNVAFRHDIDNNERILMLELPGAAWSAPLQQQFARSPLVAAYQATPDGQGGTRLAIQLRKPAKIASTQSLAAEPGKAPRVVVDIAPL